jgi:hypothetical protein
VPAAAAGAPGAADRQLPRSRAAAFAALATRSLRAADARLPLA